MRNPNGYGSVVKMSGRRRKPYMVRLTAGYNDKGYPIYHIIGYAATRAEGNLMLADYHRAPYDVNAGKLTFAEVYDLWFKAGHTQSEAYLRQLQSAYKRCDTIYDTIYRDLRTLHFQAIVDRQTPSMQPVYKALFQNLDDYAKMNDIITKSYAEFITVKHRDDTGNRKPFTEAEIAQLWDRVEENDMFGHALILIYSGWRISEYLSLDVDLDAGIMTGGVKTSAGKNRKVPIHPRIMPLVKRLYRGGKFYNYSKVYFGKQFSCALERLGMKHMVHETRHTFISRLDSADVPRSLINRLAGHAGEGTGEKVYTHKSLEELKSAINTLV